MFIREFKGEYRWLSNFFPAKVSLDGTYYPSVENAYQAAKFSQAHERRKFELCLARTAKVWGKKAILRPTWDQEKLALMKFLVEQKFRDEEFAEMLKAIPEYVHIMEGNNWGDSFWGAVINPGTLEWEGQNHLGRILMDIRDRLRAGTFATTEEYL